MGSIIPLVAGQQPGIWHSAFDSLPQSLRYRRCANFDTPAGCNWLVRSDPERETPKRYCISCRLNRVIPDLSVLENCALWNRIELAKRRVISSLVALGLPVASRISEDPQRGLAFDFLRSPLNGPRVLTGHENGLITLNVEEADDLKREQMRASMHEPYRTLVGHLRHEVGHYYWYRLIAGSHWLDGFRSIFGDETIDYAAAIRQNYEHGPQPNWRLNYVTAYASIHPWEDWAETWAHYMHMMDTLGTAASLGLNPETIDLPFDPYTPDTLQQTNQEDPTHFLSVLNAWVRLTAVLNELSRSMGQPDFYPFALPTAAASKLHFVHRVIEAERTRSVQL